MNETKFLKLLQIAHKEEQNMDSYIELSDASEKFDASRKRFLKVQDLVLDSNDYDKMYRFLQQNFENTDINKFIVKFLDAKETKEQSAINYLLCVPFLNNSPIYRIRDLVLDKSLPLSLDFLSYLTLLNKSNPYEKTLPNNVWNWYQNALYECGHDSSNYFKHIDYLFRNYAFAYLFGDELKLHEQAILNSVNTLNYGSDIGLCYHFARDIKGANIKAFEKIILNNKSYHYSYLFAKDIEQADINAHCTLLAQYNNQKFITKLLQQDIKDINQTISDIKNNKFVVVLSSKNSYCNYKLDFLQINEIVKNGVGMYNFDKTKINIDKDNYDIVLEKNREILNQLVDYSQKLDRLDNIYKTINKKIKTENNEQSQVL